MKKTYGVCLGLLAMGLAVVGAPASRAQSRMAAGGSGSGSEAATTTAAATPATSSPADLRERIDALKTELADLNSRLASETGAQPAAAEVPAPQDQAATAAPAQAPAAAAPMPLPNPAMSAPLATAIPHEVAAGPFGKIEITGILSGIGMTEGYHVPGDSPTHWDLSNGQVFVQKTTGWLQWYVQAGAYNIPSLATPFAQDGPTITNLYGPVPTAYFKLVKGGFNVEVGELPTLVGAETTFTFENMNIERGLLWNQESAISRGIQFNEAYKKLTAAFSWNDGYYSDRFTTLSGSLAYAFNASNTLTFIGQGNAGAYNKNTLATPLYQNNSTIYNLIYMYSHGPWMIMPYYQYNDVPKNVKIGITGSGHTNGGALLVNYNFKHGFSLAVRPEYIKTSGNPKDPNAINLLAGPGSGGFSFTVTPTYVKDAFFIRGDVSIVHATDVLTFGTPPVAGLAFGHVGLNNTQPRGVIEAGFLF